MALHYAFLGETDLSELTDEQHRFKEGLIWATMAIDIGYLCEDSAEEFARRCNLQELFQGKVTVEMLKPYFGLRTNVITENANKWAKKHFGHEKWDIDADTKWARKIDKIAYSPENEQRKRELEKKQANAKAAKKQAEAFSKL